MRTIPFLIAVVLSVAAARAAEQAPDPAQMQAAMEAMGRTGPEHEALRKGVGEWTVQSSMWMAPGAPPITGTGTSTISAILDGKWVKEDFHGDMMGRKFTGLGLSGYDTQQKRYVTTWLDSMSTMSTTLTGESTDGGKTITYHGEMAYCPATGGPAKQRAVLTRESDDRFTFQMFTTPEGKPEAKGMELVYTRAKP